MRHPGIVICLIAASASVTGCTTNENALDISGPISNSGKLAVDVKVNGDPSSTSRNFVLHINDEYAGPAELNARRFFTLQPGDHRISIEPEYNIFGEPSWCFVPRGNLSIVHIGRDSTTTLTLEVECPSLAGNARIRIHGVAAGANAPGEVNYLVGRIHPRQSWPSITMRIPVGGVQEIGATPGIYMILADDQSGRCDPTMGFFFGPYALDPSGYVVVREDQTVDVNNGLRCP